jgi:hypothetical protein
LAAALAALVSAESRGAPEAELRLLEEGVIAARIGELRAAAHEGHAVPAAHVNQLERDLELLRRFPEDRRGDDGLGWFDWPVRGSAD